MRGILEGNGASASLVLIGLLLSVAYLLLAYLFFIGVYRVVIRNGLIARFSSEGV
jgi:hypothetical protein